MDAGRRRAAVAARQANDPERTAMRRLIPLVAGLLLLSCSGPAPIRLGVMMRTDGVWGVELAVEQVNRAGGIDGRPVSLSIVPSDADASSTAAIAIARRFADDRRVLAVVGHSKSPLSLAASQVFNEMRVPQISPTATAPLYSRAGPYSFRVVPSDSTQAAFLAPIAMRPDAGPVGIIYLNNDYGRALEAMLRDRIDATNAVVLDAPYVESVDDEYLRMLAADVAAARVRTLFWIGTTRPLGVLLEALGPRRDSVRVVGSDAVDLPVSGDGAEAVFERVHAVRFVDPESRDARLEAVRRELVARHGAEPSMLALLAYDAVSVVLEAIEDGARDRESIRQYLAAVGTETPAFDGITGRIAFDAQGDAVREYYLAVRRDGTLRNAKPDPGR